MSSFAIGLLTADRAAKVSTEERRDNRRHPTSVTYPPPPRLLLFQILLK